MLYVEGDAVADENNRVTVPDVTGLSVAEANRLLRSCGLTMRIEGSGVASQSPEALARVTPTTSVTVTFQPP